MANDIDKNSEHYKGTFGNIYEVNKKFPTGGVEGDFVEINGWAHYWNADRGTWCVNARRDSYWDEVIGGIVEKFNAFGGSYFGLAHPDTVPSTACDRMFYFATENGTYVNFGSILIPWGISVLYTEDGKLWRSHILLEVAQEFGENLNKVISQKILTSELNKKANEEDVKEELNKKVNKTDQLETNQIKNGAITSEKIADGSITNIKLADNSVTTEKIADKSVTKEKFADNSVTTEKIADKSVTKEKLADNSVTTEKIADKSVTKEKLADGSVSMDKFSPEVKDELVEDLTEDFVPRSGGVVTGDLEAQRLIKTGGKDYELLEADGSVALPITDEELDEIAKTEPCCVPIADEVIASILDGTYTGGGEIEPCTCGCVPITEDDIDNIFNNTNN